MTVINVVGIAHIRVESALEASVVRVRLFDPRVRWIVEQPTEIYWVDRQGKPRKYVPDFYVEFIDGSWELVEVKSRYLIRKSWPELRQKLEACRRYAESRGGRMRLISDRGVDPVTHWNARFLLQYLRDFPRVDERQKIVEALLRTAPQTIGQLLTALTAGGQDPSIWPRLVWHLVVRRELRTDLSQRVGVHTRLTEPGLMPPSLLREIPDHLRRSDP